jgi:hypothetical protein
MTLCTCAKQHYTAVDFIIRNRAQVEPGRAIIGLFANQERSFDKKS